jgi:predicted TIM-barrel fold metal-dependent hydrolase
MNFFDINTALGHWPFQQLQNNDAQSLKKHLERYNVSQCLAVNTHGLFYRNVQNANIELAQWIKDDSFFVGCASINPTYPQWEKDLVTCVEKFNFKAVRLTPLYHNYDINSKETDNLLSLATKLNIPVLIPQRIMDIRQRHFLDVNSIVLPESVFALAEKHSNCKIICTETLIVDEDLPKIAPLNNLYIESSRMISGFTGLLERIVDAITPQRLLFGSGSPFKEILPAILKIEQSKLTTLDKNNIARNNSVNILGINK